MALLFNNLPVTFFTTTDTFESILRLEFTDRSFNRSRANTKGLSNFRYCYLWVACYQIQNFFILFSYFPDSFSRHF